MPSTSRCNWQKPAQFRDLPSATSVYSFSSPEKHAQVPSLGKQVPTPDLKNLPLHFVGLVALAQAEGAGEVAGEELDLLDVGNQGLVDSLLVCRSAAVDLLLL